MPLIPLVDVVGIVNVEPAQIGAIASKLGVTDGLTLTVNVVEVAQEPAFGANV